MGKLWGGRFRAQTDALMEQFNASIGFDQRLYEADIRGSQAYARSLVGAGVLTAREAEQIVAGLEQVLGEFQSGTFAFAPGDEDIHTAVERRLGELIGPTAGKLHTGRSRNDQVATDTRLYLLGRIATLQDALAATQRAIVIQAEAHLDVLMPGYTHLQPAQPILFSHWLMSYFWMLQRDRERLEQVAQRTAVLPLGASALAGNGFAVDCDALARSLGFAEVAQNSVDAVGDRDFVAEFLFWAALVQVHLSRLAEDMILWSNPALGFVEVDDRYATGSSIMPQKRNPDALELLRAKSGRLNGHLASILTTLKGLPSAYDKDLQEDKEPLFDAVDTLAMAFPIATGVIATLKVNAANMAVALDEGMLATELADYLVSKGIPFRDSHRLVGQAVRQAEEDGCTLSTLPLEAYQAIDVRFGSDLYDALDFRRAVERRRVPCGTATRAVREQIERARTLLGE
jgi:argininosuccinate lyase